MGNDGSKNGHVTRGWGHAQVDLDEDRARSALTLAQQGRVAEASEVMVDLRSRYELGAAPRVSIRILLLEAGVWYYKDRSLQSLDRARRAFALSQAAQFDDLVAESATWLSLYSFNFDQYSLLGQSLRVAFQSIDLLSDSLRARLCLTLADSCQFFGESEFADRWYRCARIFSRRTQERPILGAIEYNRIVMALSRIRLNRFVLGKSSINEQKNWVEEIKSVERLHQGLNIHSLEDLLLLGESMALQSTGEYSLAADLLESIRSRRMSSVCGMSERQLDLEIEWCKTLAGQVQSISEANLPTLLQVTGWTSAEQIIGLKQLEEIYRLLGVEFDEAKLIECHIRAVELCQLIDDELQVAVDGCRKEINRIEEMTHVKRVD